MTRHTRPSCPYDRSGCPEQLCLNCETATKTRAYLTALDHREALVRGAERYDRNARMPATFKNNKGVYC